MKYELEPYNRNVPDEELLADLSRVAKELGKNRVTIDEYNERGRFHATTLTRVLDRGLLRQTGLAWAGREI